MSIVFLVVDLFAKDVEHLFIIQIQEYAFPLKIKSIIVKHIITLNNWKGGEYFNETECRFCKDGFRPDASGKCVPIDYENCAQIIQNVGTCDYCMDNRKVVNGTCLLDESCNIQNCEMCRRDPSGNYRCAVCNNNHALNANNECVPFSGGGCLLAENETVCKLCRPGKYFKNGLCPDSDYSSVFITSVLTLIFVFQTLISC